MSSMKDVYDFLTQSKVTTQVGDKLTYSQEFHSTAKDMIQKPPKGFDTIRLARRVDQYVAPALMQYAFNIKSREDIKTLVVAYSMLERHFKIHSIKDKITPEMIFVVFQLNSGDIAIE